MHVLNVLEKQINDMKFVRFSSRMCQDHSDERKIQMIIISDSPAKLYFKS